MEKRMVNKALNSRVSFLYPSPISATLDTPSILSQKLDLEMMMFGPGCSIAALVGN